MLQVTDLTVRLTNDLRTVVEKLTFALNDGDRIVIIGEEGNGKSTLLKLIYDPTLVESYAEYDGLISRGGTRFGYLAQEFSEPDICASEFFERNESFISATPKRLYDVSAALDFPRDYFYEKRPISTFSGGEKVKLALAAILLGEPDALLLDEPSNDVDISTLEWLESYIQSCELPMIFVSHDETLIENTANAVIHIEQLVKKNVPRCTFSRLGYAEYMSRRQSYIDTTTRLAKKEKEEFDKQQEKLRKIMERVHRDQNNVSRQDPHGGRMLKKKMKSVKAQEKRFDKTRDNLTQAPALELPVMPKWEQGISVPNGKTVLDFKLSELCAGGKVLAKGIALKIVGPAHVCIVGKNGTGKTTLLREIARELRGRSDLDVFYMPQDYADEVDLSLTPVGFLAHVGDKAEIGKIRTYLGAMRYTADEMSHTVGDLSGGQKAKLFFIRAILDGANVLILDEPTRNFSPMSNPVIRALLREFGGAIISVSHDRRFISEVCSEVYSLSDGRLERCY